MRADTLLPVVTAAFIVFNINSARAQVESQDVTLVRVEGMVTLNDQVVKPLSGAIALGDPAVIQTADGRAIVGLKHGGTLAVDAHARVQIRGNGRDNFNTIEILEGTAVVDSATSAPLVTCRSAVRLSSNGVFRFDVIPGVGGEPATCRIRVFDGAAAVPLVSVTSALRSGQEMKLDPRCGDMIPTERFAIDQRDEFDRWNRIRSAEH